MQELRSVAIVTLELGVRTPHPFKWILLKYWLGIYQEGLGHAKKGPFFLLFYFGLYFFISTHKTLLQGLFGSFEL